MKTVAALLILFLAAGLTLANRQRPQMASQAERARQAGGGSCTTLKDNNSGTQNGNFGFGVGSSRAYAAVGPFTKSGTETICSVAVPIWKNGSPTSTLILGVYTHNSTQPGTLVESESTSFDGSTLGSSSPGTGAWPTFTLASPVTLSDATQYWVVIRTSAQDGVNGYFWDYFGASATGNQMTALDPPGTWNTENTRGNMFRLYSQ